MKGNLTLLLALLSPTLALANLDCGPLKNAYGPYDYTNPAHFREKLPIVEQFHYDLGVQTLRGHAQTNHNPNTVGGDLDYTLRAFPNHHRALFTLARYWTESMNPLRMRYSVDCYYERAIRFQPRDYTARMIYGIYLKRVDRLAEAIDQMEDALSIEPDSPEVHYNLALVRLDNGDVQAAIEHAKFAYGNNYPLPGLAKKLRKLGVDLHEAGIAASN